MFSIGEFSRISGLTIKTLRFYHERQLLIPAHVDAGSGYRSYDRRNLETARAIQAMRQLGLSLDAISEVLKQHSEDADIVLFLQNQKQELKQRIAQDRKTLQQLDWMIHKEKEAQAMEDSFTNDIEIKDVPELWVGGIRMKGRYGDCGKVFGRLGKALGRHIAGPALCLMYDQEYREDDADFEPCMPLKKEIRSEGVQVRLLPSQKMLTLVHRGPYEDLSRSYLRLLEFAKQNDFLLESPSREVYLKGPGMIFKGNPNKYLTEIQIPFRSGQ